MNSSPFESASPSVTKDCLNEKLNDMSPVTDLTLNMMSLKTITSGTPNRRISWSDSFLKGGNIKCMNDFSPCTDSPMLQEILMKNAKRLKRTASRKMLPLDTDGEKENIYPEVDMEITNATSPVKDSFMENNSQDSGYCSISGKQYCSTGSTTHVRVRSSLFTNTNVEELDGLLLMEEDFDTEAVAELSMKSLLTKPLCNMENSPAVQRKGKLPIRRCLTAEMESSSDSFSFRLDDFSQTDIQFSSMGERNNTASVDLEPLRRLPSKRSDPNAMLSWQSKRRKSSPSVNSEDISDITDFMKQRSFSETAATIMQAVQKADLQPDLIGDCSRCYALPLTRGRHQDLKCISPDTLVQLLKGQYREKIDSFTLVDCRYPYEFDGGHIQGAQNIYTKEDIIEKFLENLPKPNEKNVIIFHCEFSSERAPNLCRFLRNKDRELNECNYPKLHHPEVYILEGGYKAFFASFREYCEPQEYKPMNHKDHGSDLRLFRAKSKSFGADSKSRYKMKSSTENINI